MDPILQEQIDYYRARAAEYDEWLLRTGRYDQGAELNARFSAELKEVAEALDVFGARGRVLELAGGTGIWTQQLARVADELTVVDASPEMLALNEDRVPDQPVRYIQADIFRWQPDTVYNVVFFGFWLSHVPLGQFRRFWSLVSRCLGPSGRVFFVDNLRPSTSAADHQPSPSQLTTRRLNDGRQFRIYKRFYRPEELTRRLSGLGWRAHVQPTATYFVYSSARRANVSTRR